MTPSERERRIKAAVESWITAPGDFVYTRMGAALDAAEEAVPVVPATGDAGARLVALARKLARAEAAVRELADALAALYDVYTPEGVGMWLRGGKRSFGGRSPLQVIREGDVRGFVARVEQLRSGVMG